MEKSSNWWWVLRDNYELASQRSREGVLEGAKGRRLSGAWDLQNVCNHGNRNVNIYLSKSISDISIQSRCKLRLNKALIIILLLHTCIAPLQFTKYFYSHFLTCPFKKPQWGSQPRCSLISPPKKQQCVGGHRSPHMQVIPLLRDPSQPSQWPPFLPLSWAGCREGRINSPEIELRARELLIRASLEAVPPTPVGSRVVPVLLAASPWDPKTSKVLWDL